MELTTLRLVLEGISGLCWTATYVLIVRAGFKDKTYGMPLAALCANITWEFIYAFVFTGTKHFHLASQQTVNVLWFLIDLGILFTYIRFGRAYFPKNLSKYFIPNLVLALAAAYAIQYYAHSFFVGLVGYRPEAITAFTQNVLMSILFITMLIRRGSSAGQTMYIAIVKMIGTLSISLAEFVPKTSPEEPIFTNDSFFMPLTGILIFIYDAIYTVLLYRQLKQERNGPFTKF